MGTGHPPSERVRKASPKATIDRHFALVGWQLPSWPLDRPSAVAATKTSMGARKKADTLRDLIRTRTDLDEGRFTSSTPRKTRKRLSDRIAELEAQGVTPSHDPTDAVRAMPVPMSKLRV